MHVIKGKIMRDLEIEALARQASQQETLDAACAEIQGQLGQLSGDIAAAFFSGWSDAHYGAASADDRQRGLADYIRTELMFSQEQ